MPDIKCIRHNYGLSQSEVDVVASWPQEDQDLFSKWIEGRSALFIFNNFYTLKGLMSLQLEWVLKHSKGNSNSYSMLLLKLIHIYDVLPDKISIYDNLDVYFQGELLENRLSINCAILLSAVPEGEQSWLIRNYNKLDCNHFAEFVVKYLAEDKDYRAAKVLIDNAFESWIKASRHQEEEDAIRQWQDRVLTYIHSKE